MQHRHEQLQPEEAPAVPERTELQFEINENGANVMSVDALHALLNEVGVDQVTVLDLRKPGEYEQEHIPGITNYPLTTSEASLEELEDVAKKISTTPLTILICQSGVRSTDALAVVADFLDGEAQCRMVSVEGGLDAWKKAGYKTEQRITH